MFTSIPATSFSLTRGTESKFSETIINIMIMIMMMHSYGTFSFSICSEALYNDL